MMKRNLPSSHAHHVINSTRTHRGATMLEAAMVLPVFLMVVFGVIYLSLLISVQGLGDHAAHAALSYLSTSDKLEVRERPGTGASTAEQFCALPGNSNATFCTGLSEARAIATELATAALVVSSSESPGGVAYLHPLEGKPSPISVIWPSDHALATQGYYTALQEFPIKVEVSIRVRTGLPFPGLDGISITGSAAGFRESRSDLSLATPTDCKGNPIGSDSYNTEPCDCVPADPNQPNNMFWDPESMSCKYCPGGNGVIVAPPATPDSISRAQVGLHSSWSPGSCNPSAPPGYSIGGLPVYCVAGREYYKYPNEKCAFPTTDTCGAIRPGSVSGTAGSTRGGCVCYRGLTEEVQPDGTSSCVCDAERIIEGGSQPHLQIARNISAPNGTFQINGFGHGGTSTAEAPSQCICTGTLTLNAPAEGLEAGTYAGVSLNATYCRALYGPTATQDNAGMGCSCFWGPDTCGNLITNPDGTQRPMTQAERNATVAANPTAVLPAIYRVWSMSTQDNGCVCSRPGVNWSTASGATASTRSTPQQSDPFGTNSAYGANQSHWTWSPANPASPYGAGNCVCGNSPCPPNATRSPEDDCTCRCNPGFTWNEAGDQCLCATGYTGPDCSSCAEGFYRDGSSCLRSGGPT